MASGERLLKAAVALVPFVPPCVTVSGTFSEIVPDVFTNGAVNESADCLALNAIQSELVSAPRLVELALGRLKTCVEPEDAIPKSVPVVPVAKLWMALVNVFRLVMPAPALAAAKFWIKGAAMPAPDSVTE